MRTPSLGGTLGSRVLGSILVRNETPKTPLSLLRDGEDGPDHYSTACESYMKRRRVPSVFECRKVQRFEDPTILCRPSRTS